MTPKAALQAVRALWWLVVLAALLGGGAALMASLLQAPVYTSAMQLFVSTRGSESTTDIVQGSEFSRQRVTSYTELIQGDELARRVVDRLNLDSSPGQLRERIEATASAETVLIDVVVRDESAEQAREVASALSEEFISFVEELERPDGSDVSLVKVAVTDPPDVASSPSSPRPLINLVLGLSAGVVLGLLVAILRARLDRSVKDPDEVTRLAGAPVIGTVLRDEMLSTRHTIDRFSGSRTAEDYRQLRTNLQFLSVDEPPKVIMVSSALPSEGKTTAVVNLGLALADAGRRVTIIEADLRKPKVTRYLGLVGGVGLTNVLSGSADVEDVLQKHGSGDLYVIAAGPTPPNPGELLSSSHMFSLLDKLRSENDFVLVDAPPLLPVADSTGLSVYMDGVLLSVRYGSTRKEQLQQAAATLERVGAKTLGVILNIVPPKAELATAYGYGYSYSYEVDRQPPGEAETDK